MNIVLISSAIVIGATDGGGALVSDPVVARKALDLQKLHYWFRLRFHRESEEELQKPQKL